MNIPEEFKKLFSIQLLLCFLLIFSKNDAFSQDKILDSFAREILSGIASNDSNVFLKRCASKEVIEFLDTYNRYGKNIKRLEEEAQEVRRDIKRHVLASRKSSLEEGINWNDIQYLGVKFIRDNRSDTLNYTFGQVSILFKSNTLTFELFLKKTLFLWNKYWIGDKLNIRLLKEQ